MRTFIVKPKDESDDSTQQPKLLRAARQSHVEQAVLEQFDIREATPDELVDLGSKGVKIVDVAPE